MTRLEWMQALAATPLPLVIEHDNPEIWLAWDHAQQQLDAKTPEGRAMALALED